MANPLMVWALLFLSSLVYGQSTVSGMVTDENDIPLPGTVLSITGSFTEMATDRNGYFTLTSAREFPYTVQITLDGYLTRTILIDAPGDYGTITLAKGIMVSNEVVTTASRIPEKSLETIASVTTINRRQIEVTPVSGDPTEYLRNVAGVNLIRSGTESVNIELRGPVNLLETSTLVLKDHAPLTTPSDKVLTTVAGTLSPLDIAGIEVVRGPSGAIYGPNVTSGVVHYITKDAFRYPGISAMSSVGERNLWTTRVRYADNNGSKWGWKFLANYGQSKDFSIAEDQMTGIDGVTPVITTQNFETLGGKRWDNVDNLDAVQLYNWNFEGGFEFRVNDKTKLNYTASLSRARTNITSTMGHLLLGLQRFEQQARLETGNLSATIYYRYNFANVDKNGNSKNLADHAFLFNYTTGVEGETQPAHPQRADAYLDIALQYRLKVTEKLDFQVGTDTKLTPSFENELLYGVSSENNHYNIFGGYISGKYHLSSKLLVHASGRYDYLQAFNEGAFSPRTGLVYNPWRNFGIRLNFNRSVSAPSRERTWMDYNFSALLPSYFPATRIQGLLQEVTYDHPITRFPFGDVPGGEIFDVQDIIDVAAAYAGVSPPSVSGTLDPAITTASYAAPMVGFPTGFPITLDQVGQPGSVALSKVSQLELGFHHTFKQKLQINGTLYHLWIENIPYADEFVLSAGSQLNLLAISNILEQQVPAGPERDALITALYTVPPNPTGDQTFDGVPGFGVVMSDRAQQFNYAYDLAPASYSNNQVNYFGAEFSTSYFINTELSVFGNYSYLSQVTWTASDLGEVYPGSGYYLNTAPDRFNVGINYYPSNGIYGSAAVNYQSTFDSRLGDGSFFSGTNEARTLVDLQMGYRFGINRVDWDLGISVNNLFNEKYSHFRNLGQFRRFAALSLKVSL